MLASAQNQLLPETDADTLERFAVDGRLEIRAVLDELVHGHALIALYSARDHQEFVVSQLHGVDDNALRFEFTTDAMRRDAILAAGRVTVVGFLDRIKVQFDADAPRIAQRGDATELLCAPPARVHRIQRRDAFRVRPPVERPAECVLRGSGRGEEVYRVLDVSAGGVGLSIPPGEPVPPIGEIWRHCRLEMPGYAPIPCDLELRFVGESLLGEAAAVRLGCEFHRPTPETLRAVQLYVMDVERKRPPPDPDTR